ncbi:MAG: hypothetical protein ACTHL8_02600 [Burkholderiaceae bacterium]
MNCEHIIPLALGGHDEFTLPVCRRFNARAGSLLDGALANDFLVKMQRNALDKRGHSNKRPVVTCSGGMHVPSGKPLHVTLDRHSELRTWCPRLKQVVNWPGGVKINFRISLDASTKFVAKVALGAGYFAYGREFRDCVNHADIRHIMTTPLTPDNPLLETLQIKVDERFSEVGDDRVKYLRLLCRSAKRSSLVCILPTRQSFTVAVGVLGHYMGLISVPAWSTAFPQSGLYELGHVIVSQDSQLMRISFKQAIETFAQAAQRQNAA